MKPCAMASDRWQWHEVDRTAQQEYIRGKWSDLECQVQKSYGPARLEMIFFASRIKELPILLYRIRG